MLKNQMYEKWVDYEEKRLKEGKSYWSEENFEDNFGVVENITTRYNESSDEYVRILKKKGPNEGQSSTAIY